MSAVGGKPPHRSALIDVLKGTACLVIVCHHMVSYGPMVDVVRGFAPGFIAWLYDYGRFAVQVFLVVAGYVAADSLAPAGAANFRSVSVQLAKRYWRLLAPFLVALTAALAAASLARTWHHPDSVPAAASIGAVIAHLLMLQDLLGVPGLSAGVWYLSIDLQLFACTVLILAVAPWLAKHLVIVSAQHLGIALVLGLTCVSLVWLNRIPALDATALYFYGAYGMGMLTCWGVRTNTVLKRRAWFCMVSALVVAALAVDFRGRLLVAGLVAALLWSCATSTSVQGYMSTTAFGPLRYMGRISYSVFLIHYPVLLVFNALIGLCWPASPGVNLLGMLGVLACSVGLADRMYRGIETQPPSGRLAAALLAPLLLVSAITH